MERSCLIPKYIKLIVNHELEHDDVKLWFSVAKEYAPDGVFSSVQTTDDNGNLRSACLVHQEGEDDHSYVIPLTRDLTEQEIGSVVDAFNEKSTIEEWTIDTSSETTDHALSRTIATVDGDSLDDLCKVWAKKQHERWVEDRTKTGWRYGASMSMKEKTHPLLKPWHELPEQFKNVDYDQPQTLLDLLNDQGFAVIRREEYESLMSLAKKR